ncbi:condensin complex subunit 1, partial [Aplysia californica]|uniref:Condensin complex subunit 1 n=1 Tax=Aplysia californica TaxID=6500 RepID=A0ABM1W4B6_APLCA
MDFKIPSSRDDLLNTSRAGEYGVEELLTLRQIPAALQEFKSACRGTPHSVRKHFDTLFSVLCLQRDLDVNVKEEAWLGLLKACQMFAANLTIFLDASDLDREEVPDHLNTLKMSVYLLCQFLELFDSETIRPSALVTGKGRGKKTKQANTAMNMDWEYERQQGLQLLLSVVQLPIHKLWDPPLVEEEFVSLVSMCCYKLLENPALVKLKDSLDLLAHIIGDLVKRYNHGLGASLKIDQLLKHFEFLTTPLAQIVELMVQEHGCKSTVTDIVREIGSANSREAAKDSASAKAYAGFLVELGERMPAVVLPCVPLILCHLDGESYTLRNGVLGMMGSILTTYLCKEELDEKSRLTRDAFFEKLEDHIHDVNAFVRSKVLQIWLSIVTEQCLPLLQQESLMALVVGRLHDKSSIVRRHALQLLTALLKSNPFAAQLPVEDLRSNYEKEKAQLKEMNPTAEVAETVQEPEVGGEWAELEDELVRAMEGLDVSVKSEEEEEEESAALIGGEDSADEVLQRVVSLLEGKEWHKAVALVSAAKDNFPDLPVFSAEAKSDSSDEMEGEEEGKESRASEQEVLLTAIKNVFHHMKQPIHLQAVPDVPTADDSVAAEIAKQQTLVQYLKNSLTFASQVQQCIPVICQLLGSKNSSDVLEAVQFFVTAVQFGVSAAQVGVRRMLVLVWSQEQTVREAVVEAYRTLYLQPKEKNQRNVAVSVVKNLTALLVGATVGDLASLETLVSEFVQRGHIGPAVVQALWERLALKSGAVTTQDSRAAVQLIAMCAQAEPEIVKSNIDVLVQEGLGERAERDYLLAQGVCQALMTLAAKPKQKGKPASAFRLEPDHELFTRLTTILSKGIHDTTNCYWIPLGDQAVTLIFRLAETPDLVCARLLRELVKEVAGSMTRDDIADANGGSEGPERPPLSGAVSSVLARVLSLAGQVAFRQTVYLEVDVLTEMKRRQAAMEEGRQKGGAARRKSKGSDSSKVSQAAEMEEDAALDGASAEDSEAEFVRRICELELLSDENFLSAFPPILVAVCSNTDKFGDRQLQTAASLALARFMIISCEFCESHLQLVFTLLERSPSPVIRSNLIIALGDLTFRFPNLVEPWTAHLYARLRDDSPSVRKTTLQVLTHLILNDMVKVKGQISELATCIVDPDDRISGLAKLFFHELAKKGNSMYNMPDIISRLSDPDIGVEEENFQTIIKYVFSHIEKSKHCESLAEKLCHRFRAVRTERQVRDLSFCLSQLSYTEKGIGKLMENFACFADKLVDQAVYGHFCQILSKSRQFVKPEAKAVLEEFEDKLSQAHTRGLDQEGAVGRAAGKSVCERPVGRAGGRKTPARKKP